jgi:fumarylacetoacetase
MLLLALKVAEYMEPLSTWLDVSADSDFSIHNIPFGICSLHGSSPRVCTRIGNYVIDLSVLHRMGYLPTAEWPEVVFENNRLNEFISMGKQQTSALRKALQDLFSGKNPALMNHKEHQATVIHTLADVRMLMPVHIPNYTDFYSSKEHATNVGMMFRDPANALLPNWLHLPVGYHGRASSITVSGTPFHRPHGQVKPPDAEMPFFSASRQLDFELEMAFIIGKPTGHGQIISTEEAEEYIFGMVIFNDWSARDIQAWEYVPLGPFLGKNFNSTISPWVVTLEALEPFRKKGPAQNPPVLPYLQGKEDSTFDIELQVDLIASGGVSKTLCNSNFSFLYWSMAQQLAHHTVNGCNVQTGDVYASGTISGSDPASFGSMLELTWRGTKPVLMPDGTNRKFVEDGDTIVMKAWSSKEGIRVGFGSCESKVLPAIELK